MTIFKSLWILGRLLPVKSKCKGLFVCPREEGEGRDGIIIIKKGQREETEGLQ